jgi:hypothetical protein
VNPGRLIACETKQAPLISFAATPEPRNAPAANVFAAKVFGSKTSLLLAIVRHR